jgi:ATP-dependent RNA helicase DeaD
MIAPPMNAATPIEAGTFADLGLSEPVLAAVREVGYEQPSPIQRAAIPPLLEGRNVLGQAQTGTGKTAAFALPLLCRLDLQRAEPQLLVLTPTRELAIQVAEAMQVYARHLPGFHVLPVYGGAGMDLQLKQLRRGVHAIVGTPGRILDHLRRKTLKLGKLKAVVIDEADELLRMGFIDDVEEILGQCPAEKQVAMFSATLPQRIRHIVERHLADAVEVKIKSKTATVATVDQRYVEVRGFDKLDALTRILEVEDFEAMLIFVRTRQDTVAVSEKLEARGLSCAALSGEMSQPLRERTVERLKNGKLDIVVATDIAARGLDVDRITHVVNFDIPHDVEGYIHRIGRTGRAGRTGHAILFVTPRERRMLQAIERATKQNVTPMHLPSNADVTGRRTAQFKERIGEVLAGEDLTFFAGLVTEFAAEQGKDTLDVAAALAFLAQRERPLLLPPEPKRAPPPRATERFDDRRPAPHDRPGRERPGRDRPGYDRPGQDRPRAPAHDRPPAHAERPPPEGPRRSDAGPSHGHVRYRIEVGHEHGVQPGNIVGAIANEAGIDAKHIGRINIFEAHSTVDLPEGMPADTRDRLRRAYVCGQKLMISVDSDVAAVRRPPSAGKPKKKRKDRE